VTVVYRFEELDANVDVCGPEVNPVACSALYAAFPGSTAGSVGAVDLSAPGRTRTNGTVSGVATVLLRAGVLPVVTRRCSYGRAACSQRLPSPPSLSPHSTTRLWRRVPRMGPSSCGALVRRVTTSLWLLALVTASLHGVSLSSPFVASLYWM
jgi:hypothetical protein